MTRNGFFKLALFSTTFLAAQADVPNFNTAQAQQLRLEEIVVTARKREESLLEVPLSISALTADQIDTIGIKDVSELADFIPGFFMNNQNGSRSDRGFRDLKFRGLTLSNNTFVSSGGQVFVDGAPALGGEVEGLSEIERVEVLRGPQNTYFGRSALSGAINFITKKPNMEEFGGRVDVEFSRHNSSDITLALEGPLVENKLAIRVATHQLNQGGSYENAATGGRLGGRQTESYSLSLYATPTDKLEARLSLSMFEHDDDPSPVIQIKRSDGLFNCDPGAGGGVNIYICGDVPGAKDIPASFIAQNSEIDAFRRAGITDRLGELSLFGADGFHTGEGFGRRGYQASFALDYEFNNGIEFAALSAYHHDQRMLTTDLTYRDTTDLPNPNFGVLPNVPSFVDWFFGVEFEAKDWSQEFRITSPEDQRLRWMVGGTYIGAKVESSVVYGITPTNGLPNPATRDFQHVETFGGFGALNYDITDDLTLGLEARYQSDKRRDTIPATGFEVTETYNSVAPRVTLDYQIDDITVYALWARGIRPGGFNRGLAILDAADLALLGTQGVFNIAYDEEQLDMYEIGAKGTLLDGRATFAVGLYAGELKDQQIQDFLLLPRPDGSLLGGAFVNNLGSTDLKGVEVEGQFLATENLTLSATFALNETEIGNFVSVQSRNFITGSDNVTGNRHKGVAKTSGSFSAQYDDDLTGDYDWYARADYIYRGNIWLTEANVAGTGDAHVVNIRAGITTDTMKLEAFVDNLFDDDTMSGGTRNTDLLGGFTSAIGLSLPNLRMFGVRASYNF